MRGEAVRVLSESSNHAMKKTSLLVQQRHTMPCYIIRTVRLAHCKLGPSRCEKCREMDAERVCLLDICPQPQGKMQRRAIEVSVDGRQVWREFEIARVFEGVEEAMAYAAEQGIEDVML